MLPSCLSCSVQVGFLVGVMMGFFLLTSNSLFIKLSRYDFYFSEFRVLYTTFAVELALMLTVKIYQGVSGLGFISSLPTLSFISHECMYLHPTGSLTPSLCI